VILQLKREAQERGVPYQVLMRMLIVEGLKTSRRQSYRPMPAREGAVRRSGPHRTKKAMLRYPVKLTREGSNTLVSFPDVPGAHTFGANKAEALARGLDALETMFMGIMSDRDAIPLPSPFKRGAFVELSTLTEAKVLLYGAMRARGIGKGELARRLDCHLPHIDRLLDLTHARSASKRLRKRASLIPG
jgi:antitoxin HicB